MWQAQNIMKILLIEDNEGDIILTREKLREGRINIELTCLIDGEKAIDFLTEIKTRTTTVIPDLILLDINLPKVNGHEIMEFIKMDTFLSTIPVFVLSSSDNATDIELAKEKNAIHYLVKPLNISDFLAGIKKINSADG
jgi:chemotaxis family two-component system response regulator Rcp1